MPDAKSALLTEGVAMADADPPEDNDAAPFEDDQAESDRTHLMTEVAEQMDAIEADFGPEFKIGRVLTLVEIHSADGQRVELRVRAGQFPWVSLGMLEYARTALKAQIQRGGEGD
jgi:hypothetical protein